MKRSKRIYILLGVLAFVCAATFGVTRYEEHKEQIRNSDEIILTLEEDSVQAIAWENESGTFAFHKDDKWLYDEDEAFPVSEDKIHELLELFKEFGVSFIIEEVEDYGQYGLEEPICIIRLTTEEQEYEILLGNYSNMDSQRYVSIGDGNVYLVQNDPLDYFDAVLSDMIDHDEIPSYDNATQIAFDGEEAYTITYQEDSNNTYSANDVYFTQQDGAAKPLDTSKVNSYLSNISYLDLTNYVTYNVSEEELQSYGLDDPELTVTVDYTEEEEGEEISGSFILHVSRDPEEKKAAEEASEEKEDEQETEEDSEEEEITAYARVGDSQIVYRITGEEYEELLDASYDSLRHAEVFWADFSEVTQIDISLEDTEYTITSEEPEEEEDQRTYYYREEEFDIADLRSAIRNLRAGSFTDEQPEKQEEISLTIHLDNENHPQVEITLYRYDGDNCLAAVDGETVSLVSRSYVVDLIEAVHTFALN